MAAGLSALGKIAAYAGTTAFFSIAGSGIAASDNIGIAVSSEAGIPGQTLEHFLCEHNLLMDNHVLVRMDKRLSDTIAVHAGRILSEGYAKSMDPDDFFHGHLLADTGDCSLSDSYPSSFPRTIGLPDLVARLLESNPHFLYHTREARPSIATNSYHSVNPLQMAFWNREHDLPRSIIGTQDGSIFPVSADNPLYKSLGTVNSTDQFSFNGHTYHGMCSPVSDAVIIDEPEGRRLYLSNMMGAQFFILKDSNGRYRLEDGSRYDIFFTATSSRSLLDEIISGKRNGLSLRTINSGC